MIGLGGSLVEVLGKVVFRAPPLDKIDARQMIAQCGAGKILDVSSSDHKTAVVDVLLHLSVLAQSQLGISSIQINPLVLSDDTADALALDAVALLE